VSSKLATTIFACLLAAHLALLSHTALRSSICYDEGAHLASGVAYLKQGELTIYNLTPPLLRMWAALPAVAAGAEAPPGRRFRSAPEQSRHWMYFEAFQQDNLARVHRFVLWGRFMLMPFSLGTAAMIFFWGRKLYSDAAALLSTAAWCFSPVIIANAGTLSTDIPCAFAIFLSCGLWMRFLRTRRNSDAAWTAIAVAIAHAIKFTALLLWPLMLAIAAYQAYRDSALRKPAAVGIGLSLLCTFIFVNAMYGFSGMNQPLGSFDFRSSTMQSIQRLLPRSMPVPLSQTMVIGFDAQKWESEGIYISALFDQGYLGNDWRFYPWCLITKSTLGGLLLALLTGASLLIRKPRQQELAWLVVLALLALFTIAYMKINISLRYLLPAYPPLILLMGRVVQIPRLRWAGFIAAAAIAVESLAATPHYHSFVNLAARPWRKWVPDQDWGQSLIDLKRWMDAHGQTSIDLIHFGRVNPLVYGIHTTDPIAPPTTPYVAVGKQMMIGIPIGTRDGQIFVRAWRELRDQVPPVAELDGMNVYRAQDVLNVKQQPWIIRSTLQEALRDPAALPIRGREQQ
jgi:hypothetical protein